MEIREIMNKYDYTPVSSEYSGCVPSDYCWTPPSADANDGSEDIEVADESDSRYGGRDSSSSSNRSSGAGGLLQGPAQNALTHATSAVTAPAARESAARADSNLEHEAWRRRCERARAMLYGDEFEEAYEVQATAAPAVSVPTGYEIITQDPWCEDEDTFFFELLLDIPGKPDWEKIAREDFECSRSADELRQRYHAVTRKRIKRLRREFAKQRSASRERANGALGVRAGRVERHL
mmetsp:Transcript_9415/g.25060  ORF Transcript_9415/g.25060 Transcript_9415/m.25060 type:complete len:236 (-) Transcript_9415:2306-3013(-)